MKLRVLGCSGSIARGCPTTSFLLDGQLLVDAGTGVADLTLDEMAAIDHVLLTHSHLDHIAALPLLADAVAARRTQPLQVHALQATIDALKAHVFNNIIWPDFSVIPTSAAPFIRFNALQVGQRLTLAGRQIEVLPAVHSVPSVGYAVSGARGHWVFTGDTERNPALWERLNRLDVAMLVIEAAFSNGQSAMARRSLHLCPDSLLAELDCIAPGRHYPIYISHTKPAETQRIMAELQALTGPEAPLARQAHDLHWLRAGQEFEL